MKVSQSPWTRILLYALATATFLFAAIGNWKYFGGFWDARIYRAAVNGYLHGVNPYALMPGMDLFLYPPVFLGAALALSKVLPSFIPGWSIYIAAYVAAVLGIWFCVAWAYLRKGWMGFFAATACLALAPNAAPIVAVLTGNFSVLCYGALLLAALAGLRRRQWLPFYAVLLCCALVKPPFLLMLALPLFIGRKQLARVVATSGVVVVGYAAQRALFPQLFAGFRTALIRGSVAGGDIGYSVFGLVFKAIERHGSRLVALAYVAHLACVIVAAAVLLLIRKRCHPDAWNRDWLSLLLVAIVLANPRMKDYDVIIAIVPAAWLLWRARQSAPALAAMIVCLLPVPLVSVVGHTTVAEFLLLLAAFCSGVALFLLPRHRRAVWTPEMRAEMLAGRRTLSSESGSVTPMKQAS